jgi:uncharacterized protein (TIGR03790 family)
VRVQYFFSKKSTPHRVNLRQATVVIVLAAGACGPALSQGLGDGLNARSAAIAPSTAHRLGAEQLAVIVNDDDPDSVQIGEYYQRQRKLPAENVVHVHLGLAPGAISIDRKAFAAVKSQVDQTTPHQVQAYALAWTTPFRVDCMSITTAFAAGFDEAFCATGCVPTKISPYFNSNSWAPYRHYHWRPAMMLAGASVTEVKKLIDRGVNADGTAPKGTGYLVETRDKFRSVRSPLFDPLIQLVGKKFELVHLRTDFIEDKKDVLFYFTGAADVPKIGSNTYRPGAMTDHLTSAGGVLNSTRGQMSVLRWLEAGATASFGAVVEPCNFPQKFPNPALAVMRYLGGDTAIEAYWKSVAMPGQGVFVGEPLARPFGAASP